MTDHSETKTSTGNPATKIAVVGIAAAAAIGIGIAFTDDASEPNVNSGPSVNVTETSVAPTTPEDTESAAQMEFSGNAVSPGDTAIYTSPTNDGSIPDG